jgi:SAM-dependent methyltransferase
MEIARHFLSQDKAFTEYDQERAKFQEIYSELLASEAGLMGRVLDIGCGHNVNPTIEKIIHKIGSLDGVDPFPVIEPTYHLKNRWVCKLEDIPVEPETYDLAYSYNVVEHVENVDAFLKTTLDLLKPGGVYFSLSPNANHPFTHVVKLLQSLNLKKFFAGTPGVNDYPAYYRLCKEAYVLQSIKSQSLNVEKVDFYYIPNVQWDSYFPNGLRWLPHFWEKNILLKRPETAAIFCFRMQKGK